ncbi:LPS export ABC transporter permease LptG [Ovoidimarina sediminis]|uniref:LPS export ABC transporter permease LptG n=1 Tax=Ovoidimarina sediminis TaxID=3079856 RepID=UPI0029121538|nr:LPS export ABC transporter permease LptG [Rhodophyticola sp. MJ-SS7]MDU8945654.1 LPS export ABC transporter permease LptG [Rhodophyticola sp. MJ-SS7]
MTLHLYIARRFLFAFLAVFAGLFLMLALVDLVEQIRRFNAVEISFGALMALTFLNVPESIYRILPLITILAAIALFVNLSRNSELVIARAAGRAALTSVFAPVFVAVALGALGVAVLNPIVAATSKQYEVLADRYLGQRSSVLSVSPEGLWLRQGGETGQTVIRAARANLDGTVLFEVTFLAFGEGGTPQSRLEARQAELRPGVWALQDAKEWTFGGGANPEANAKLHEEFFVPTNLTRDEIADSFGTPSAIPIWELPGFIDRLEAAGFSARQHKVWLQMEMALPVLLGAMVLVAAGFTLRPARFGRTGLMVVLALSLGFTLYFIRNFSQILGENGQVPVSLAAWGPPLAAALLPIGLLLHLEDG